MAAVLQRPLRGSRISSFYPVKNLPSLASLDSAFQLQEYISLLIRLDVHDVDAIVSIPGKSSGKEKETAGESEDEERTEDGEKEKKSEIAVDEACWIYEQLRRLAQDLSHPLITTLQQECTRASCPEMKAGEWLYLCVAHGNDGAMEQCCAIDYILHTLDSATALLNSPRAFPSRLQIPQASHRHFPILARRLGRIFAHSYFHHREAFEQAEAESSLYARFLTLTSKFDLVPADFHVIPPRLTLNDGNDRRDVDVQPPRLLAAAVDPQGILERDQHGNVTGFADWNQGDKAESEGSSSNESKNEKSKSSSPPGLGTDSPRKFGRNRTDTMVFSDAFHAVEELAKAENDTSAGSSSHAEAGEFSILERRETTVTPEPEALSSAEEARDATSSNESGPTVPTTEAPDQLSSGSELSPAESPPSVGLIDLEHDSAASHFDEGHPVPWSISPSSSTALQSDFDAEATLSADEENSKEQADEKTDEAIEPSPVHLESSVAPEVDPSSNIPSTELSNPSDGSTDVVEPPEVETVAPAEETESDTSANPTTKSVESPVVVDADAPDSLPEAKVDPDNPETVTESPSAAATEETKVATPAETNNPAEKAE